MWLNLYGREVVRHKLKNGQKKTKNPIFDCFRAYVGQPHNHIGWATSMPFASFNPTNPRTNPVDFHKKLLRVCDFEKYLFLSRPFCFVFSKKKIALSPWKLVTNYVLEWMGLNFYAYDGLQPKTTPPKHFSRQCTTKHWKDRSFTHPRVMITGFAFRNRRW